jgi:hypothetical protein
MDASGGRATLGAARLENGHSFDRPEIKTNRASHSQPKEPPERPACRARVEGEARNDLALMAPDRKQRGGWSYKEDRRLLELAKQSKSAQEIENLMNRSPNAIRKMAIRLGVSLNKNRKAKGK